MSLWSITPPDGKTYRLNATLRSSLRYSRVITDEGILLVSPTSSCKSTPGSKYCRSELRELQPDGKRAFWPMGDGKEHTLSLKLAVRTLSHTKPSVVVGQIHGSDDEVLAVRCWRPTRGALRGRTVLDVFSDSTVFGVLDDNYMLGSTFDIKIMVAQSGAPSVQYTGGLDAKGNLKSSTVECRTGRRNRCFFKAGSYVQSNERPSVRVEVMLYEAVIQHQD